MTNPVASEEFWPKCEHPGGCDEPVNPKRVKLLGKVRCLEHGDKPKEFTVAPAYNKGAFQLISPADVKDIGR